MPRKKDTPPASDPRPDRNPGYAETEPRDKDDARQRPEPRSRNPDEGELERDPDRPP